VHIRQLLQLGGRNAVGIGEDFSVARETQKIQPFSNDRAAWARIAPGLLRVKPEAGFFRIYGFYSVLWLFNNLGHLLFALAGTSMASTDWVLILF
jgi:hypothetical protein